MYMNSFCMMPWFQSVGLGLALALALALACPSPSPSPCTVQIPRKYVHMHMYIHVHTLSEITYRWPLGSIRTSSSRGANFSLQRGENIGILHELARVGEI